MVMKRKTTFMSVDADFFDQVFEPARKRTMDKLGISKLGQREFSQMIFKSGMKFDIKLNMKPLRKNVKKNIKR